MPEPFVVDANFVLNLLLPQPLQPSCQQLTLQWIQQGHPLAAPSLLAYETTSVLAKGVAFGQLTPAEANRALDQFHELPIELVEPTTTMRNNAFDWTLRLNRAATYDSFYLALAQTLRAQFWTADKILSRAVNQPWVRCVS